jgi:anti-sigma factor NepR-like protein
VNRGRNSKDRRLNMPGASKKMDQSVETGTPADHGATTDDAALAEPETGLAPNLQAHIGRHVRAVFDEVAREPIPEHLLRLLKDLERSGDK